MEAYVLEYWELKPKGLSVLIQCISRDRSWFGGAMFKEQDSHMGLEAVSSRAEMIIDRPGAVPLLLCCRSMLAKVI